MSKLNFFIKIKKQYGQTLFEEVCRNFYYKQADKDTVLIHINREGKTFYVILNGSVGINIYLPRKNVQEAEVLSPRKRKMLPESFTDPSPELFEKQEVTNFYTLSIPLGQHSKEGHCFW
jgi:hypothetical protein